MTSSLSSSLRFLLLGALLTAPQSAAQAQPKPSPMRPMIQVGSPAPDTQAAPSASKTPSTADIDRAAVRVASVLDGVLKNCPADFSSIGTAGKRCIGVPSSDIESLRQKLTPALGRDLYGVWRSRDDQRSVFNWLLMPSGPVYLRLEPDASNAGRTLIYLDAPTVPAGGSSSAASSPAPSSTDTRQDINATVTVINGVAISKPNNNQPSTSQTSSAAAPAPLKATAPKAAPKATTTPPQTTLAIMPFTRTLQLQQVRLHGPDVLSVQNRLIALTLDAASGSKGDGWYGPNTTKAVSDFQRANGLKVTGQVDKATWDKLFSPTARQFKGNR